MKRNKSLLGWAISALLTALGPALTTCRAQLVADGATAFINGTNTNLTGDLTVGTNGAFTSLVITNAGAVTNSGAGNIGLNFGASSNRVIVTGANSVWGMGGNLNLGYLGSQSQLLVTNGGTVQDNFGNLAFNGGGGESAIVTGANSVWTNQGNLNIGNIGSFNRVTVSNGGTLGAYSVMVGNSGASNQLTVVAGGKIISLGGTLGNSPGAAGNVAAITGAGSQWTSSSDIEVGRADSFNQMFVTNGGKVFAGGLYVGDSGSSNVVIIAGAGSTWTNTATGTVGYSGSFNELFITNGGVMQNLGADASLTVGVQASSGSNLVMIAGANSLFSNQGGGIAQMIIGSSGSGNQLLVNGGTAQTEALYVGYTASSSNNAVTIADGNLIATNASGSGVTEVRSGALTLYTGLLQTDRLLLTNGQQSQFTLSGGTLQTGSTIVTNGGTFIVGNGNFNLPPATFQLQGNGSHAFEQGIYVMNNSILIGNGTINGMLTVRGGGTLAPGLGGIAPAFGKITLARSPLFQGVISMKLSKTGALLTNDQIQVNAPLFYGSWLVVSNIGPDPLTLGDRFKLFSGTTLSGYLSAIYLPPLSPGLNWTNKLVLDGSIEVVPWSGPKLGTDLSSPALYLDATDGFPGGSFDVLASTNIAAANWTVVASGYFDWNGVASAYVGTIDASPARFFRLQIHWP